MDFIGTFLGLIIIIVFLLYVKYKQKINYWKRNNVERINLFEMLRKAKNRPMGLVVNEYYQQMCAEKKPFKVVEGLAITVVIVQDLEAVKDIMITHFESFPDRGLYVNHRDALSTNLSRLDYAMWKPLRQKLSPAFSPAKMKFMFPTLRGVTDQFLEVLGSACESNLDHEVEMYDLCARFTMDIIGTVAFGIECNSLREPNTEFRVQADRLFYQVIHPTLDMLAAKCPKPFQLINFHILDRQSNEFFTRVFKESMEYREKNNIRRRDFMDILIELKNERVSKGGFELTLELMVGQVFAFFVAGFETSSCTMGYALFELAKHPEIQNKARLEVLEIMAKNDNQLTFDSLKDMVYLKQIMQETLRKYPIVPLMPRICRRPCTLRTSSGSSLNIPKGTMVAIPFYGIQHNPEYYPEHEKFRPERFSEEEVAKRPPCTFLAFGAGPKVCIGELFGKLQVTLGLALLLSKFQFSVGAKTAPELKFDPKNLFLLYVKEGIHLKVEKLK